MRKRRDSAQPVEIITDSSRYIFAFLILFVFVTPTHAQDAQHQQREEMSLPSKSLPSAIQNQLQAMGNRMRIPGREETVLDAQFVDDVGHKKTIHVIHQISGMVRIEGMHEKSAVTFDGEFTHGVADRTDDALIDTFVSETTEGMFYSLHNGASMVLLGHDFQLDSHAASGIKGPRYDIYVVTAPDRVRRTNILQSRRFYFDSTTGLLASTRYSDSVGVNVETRFLNWEYIDGSAYPTIIERYESGRVTLSITATRLAGQSPRNTESFK